jgi:endonuclease/exonuclease/phosphatase (EEP) superfamily protein YafD
MTIVVWALVTPFVVWALLRLFGLERGWLLVCGMAFTPYVAAAAPLPLLLALLTQRWWAAAVAGAAVLALAAAVLPRAVGRPEQGDGPTLRVLTANLLHGDADVDAIVTIVRERRVDLLALQEYTPLAQKKLIAAGLGELLPERSVHPEWEGTGSALYSRSALTPTGSRVNPGGYRNACGTLRVPGAPPLLVESVHPAAPWAPHQMPNWWAGQAAQPRADPDGPVRLLIGDFNATLDHRTLRTLIRSGYRDAASVAGRGLAPTWHYDVVPLPGAALDHVLADQRIRVRKVAVYPIPGSDHRAVLAELVLPPG